MPHYSFSRTELSRVFAHNGNKHILSGRAFCNIDESQINFIDFVELPPGSDIGIHRHSENDEELYCIIYGIGNVIIDNEMITVGPGDILHNYPGSIHGMFNGSAYPIKMMVIDIRRGEAPYHEPENINAPDLAHLEWPPAG